MIFEEKTIILKDGRDRHLKKSMITFNALTAADSVIIPVQAQYLPAKGMTQLLWMNCLQTQKAMNCCTAPPGSEDKPMPRKKNRTSSPFNSILPIRHTGRP